MSDLFTSSRAEIEEIYPEVFLLPSFADSKKLQTLIKQIVRVSPFRKMQTPMGHYTSVEMTNCGTMGWTSDSNGYRYLSQDPLTKKDWPAMPSYFRKLSSDAASRCGFSQFQSNACLINHYQIGNKLGSHQDKDEGDFDSPIVSVSVGLPAIFQIYGNKRSGIEKQVKLYDGDVLVWGGQSRMIYHGVKTIQIDPNLPLVKDRFNITFRFAASNAASTR